MADQEAELVDEERQWVEAMLNWEARGELAVDPMAVEGEG